MSAIWQHDRLYSIFRPYVDWCTRTCYSALEISGRENIPDEGAIILAPNHCNTLMDALVVLQAFKGPSAYGARADIFRKPKVASLLRFLRILPLARQRDGRNAVAGNDEVFDEVVDCLDHGVPFCMFSEGTHRTKHSLQPLKKGIFRIATRAAGRLDKPVYIVPVGLDYDDYFRLMKQARVSFGEPIRVYADSDQHEVLDTLYKRISGLITFFPDDENYDKAWEAYRKSREKKYSAFSQVMRILAAVLTLPFFIISALLCCPMWIAAAILGGKLKDKAWLNTVRYCTKFALLPVVALLVGIPAFILLPWYWALAVLFTLLISHSMFYYLQGWYFDIINSLKK